MEKLTIKRLYGNFSLFVLAGAPIPKKTSPYGAPYNFVRRIVIWPELCRIEYRVDQADFITPSGEENPMLFAPKEKGQGLVEYALILVLVAVVVIVILAILGPSIGNIFSNVVNSI